MIYLLLESWNGWLVHHGLWGYFRVFTFVEFRAILSIIFSFAMVLALGKPTIRWLLRMKFRDNPEFYNADLNELMKDKGKTPTMGGVLIVGAILAAAVLFSDLGNFYVLMALLCLLWLTGLGMWDDYLKLTSARRQQRAREGLLFWEKLVFQLGLAVLLGLFIHHHGDRDIATKPDIAHMTHCLNLPLLKTWAHPAPKSILWVPSPSLIVLGPWAFVVLTTIVIAGSSNAVNLTDGMDGLASGIMTIVAFAFMILALIAGIEYNGVNWAKVLLVPHIPESAELAVLAGGTVGACLGFLWFNCSPARVFMGDTGSLPLGGLIGFIAVVIRQEFLLLVIGGVFVFEAVSVMLQVGYFKFSKGRRIFKCSPVHHHFHLSGWTEQQVVVRFWIVSIILAAIALATIKLR